VPIKPSRLSSRLTSNTLALVLAGGRGSRLGVLTDKRTKPAVPFGGKFRIIDFALSNCLNSNIRRICVLTQYKSHSLTQHMLKGWMHIGSSPGNYLEVLPAQQWIDDEQWYQGTADAVYQSLDIIVGHAPEYVLILAGDHIYGMDYGEMVAAHVDSGADFTVACHAVPIAEAANQFGVMGIDENSRITDFQEKPANPKPIPGQDDLTMASMGIYVFSTDYLKSQLMRDAEDKNSSHDFGNDIIPYALSKNDHVQAYRFESPIGGQPYWRDVGTIDAYYQANMELLNEDSPFDLYDQRWRIFTYQPQLPAARFMGRDSFNGVENAIVSGGCEIDVSKLHDSILFSNVKVYQGSELKGVLALPGCEIGRSVRLNNVILDNQCRVPDGTVIGENPSEDAKRFKVSEAGVIIVNREMLGQKEEYIPGVLREG
jgi:glucose-1-phosphate adenylyltransferase